MRRCLLVAMCLLLVACSSQPVQAPVGDRERRPVPADGYHTVRRGDSLYSIAWLYGLDAQQLARWNRLSPPYTIYLDQRLRLKAPPRRTKPAPVSRPKPVRPAPKVIRPSAPKTTAAKPVKKMHTTPVTRKPVKQPAASEIVRWHWPARGRLISRFDPRLVGKKGISIAGKANDPVRAAAAGKVVYAGSGLTGYGRLIIIKHNQEFLSAYAHNRKLIAREGEWVKANQLIARMGDSGASRTQLYFEIRKDGAPVDPLRYLPRR